MAKIWGMFVLHGIYPNMVLQLYLLSTVWPYGKLIYYFTLFLTSFSFYHWQARTIAKYLTLSTLLY
jgi:hypothetical protein